MEQQLMEQLKGTGWHGACNTACGVGEYLVAQ
jgi:hypothetical protein